MSDAWVLVDPLSGVVCLFGEYDISSDRCSVGDDLRFALRAYRHPCVLDLSGLRFADSCLLNVLAEAALEGVCVNVKNPPPIVRRALHITGVAEFVGLDRTKPEQGLSSNQPTPGAHHGRTLAS